jgi:TnpA family transposase
MPSSAIVTQFFSSLMRVYRTFPPVASNPAPAPVKDVHSPEQWDQLVRVAASLKNRVCSAHVVVQRLANSSPSDRLAKAFSMLGRVVKNTS